MGKYKTMDVSTPVNGFVVIKDVYWLCKDGDLKQAIFFEETAQCNRHIEIPQRMKDYTEDKTGWKVSIVFAELSYRPQV